MNFKFSDEQTQLRDSLARFLRKDYSFDKRREILKSATGCSAEVWKQFADMGLLAIGLPEDHGGLGGGAEDTLIVMEEFGRGLVVEPYLATVVLSAGLIARSGSDAQKAALLPGVAAGEKKLALAHYESGGRYDLTHVTTTATKDKNGYSLNGAKAVVLHGNSADTLLVSAKTATGISLFVVDAKATGLTRHGYPTHDGHRAADITLKNVTVSADALIGKEGAALPLIEQALDYGIAALCAEAVGNMTALHEATVTYLKTRKQFGVALGSFQVLQHRAADMLMQLEQARSMAYLATAKVSSTDAAERRRCLSAAKTFVGQAARYVGQQAVQLHGGIGVTEELAVGHYFKRLTLINATFGDADHHLGLFSDSLVKAA